MLRPPGEMLLVEGRNVLHPYFPIDEHKGYTLKRLFRTVILLVIRLSGVPGTRMGGLSALVSL